MRFGSVEFFKVLIKTVLAILFFVPLIIAVVFGVFLVKKNTQLQTLENENAVLVGERIGTADEFYSIFSKSGVSYEELVALLNKDKALDADSLYDALHTAGISDADIIAAAASKRTVNGDSFYSIMTKNGITDKDLMLAILKRNGGNSEGVYELLKQCGMSDSDIAGLARLAGTPFSSSGGDSEPNVSEPGTSEPNSGESNSSDPTGSDPGESSVPNNDDSPYSALYSDLYVSVPAQYVREQGTVYLTFDDGPSQHTQSVLWILRQYGIKATFFVVPNRSEECYTLLKQIAADGHSIGVHSATHKYEQIYASVEDYLADFYEAWDIVRDATGISTPIFRFPGGTNNDFDVETRDAIIKEMTRRGFRYYDWNVQSNDIAGVGWTAMYNNIPSEIKTKYRSFVLFHDTSYDMVLVLDDIIKVLKGEGYKFDKINDDTQPMQFIGPFA